MRNMALNCVLCSLQVCFAFVVHESRGACIFMYMCLHVHISVWIESKTTSLSRDFGACAWLSCMNTRQLLYRACTVTGAAICTMSSSKGSLITVGCASVKDMYSRFGTDQKLLVIISHIASSNIIVTLVGFKSLSHDNSGLCIFILSGQSTTVGMVAYDLTYSGVYYGHEQCHSNLNFACLWILTHEI